MNGLVIDCSTRWIVCGLVSHDGQQILDVAEFNREAPRESSTRLVTEIQTLVRSSGRPDWILCSLGPGSFTGIRIGVSTARDLAQLWKIPLCGIDTLTLYAAALMDRNAALQSGNFALMIDGRQNRYYTKGVRGSHIPEIAASAILDLAPTEYPQQVGLPTVVTDAPASLGWPGVSVIPLEGSALTARSFMQTALALFPSPQAGRWEDAVPIYVRNDPARTRFPLGFASSPASSPAASAATGSTSSPENPTLCPDGSTQYNGN